MEMRTRLKCGVLMEEADTAKRFPLRATGRSLLIDNRQDQERDRSMRWGHDVGVSGETLKDK